MLSINSLFTKQVTWKKCFLIIVHYEVITNQIMSLITRNTTVAATELKQYEVVTRGDSIKLKYNGSNFSLWLES